MTRIKRYSATVGFFGPPKTNPSTSSTNPSKGPTDSAPAVKFDKEKWVAGLSEEQKTLLKLEIETLHESWLAVLKDEITTKSFLDLKKFLKSEAEAGKKIFPPSEDVYSCTVKAVILGQDPYHNLNQAHGLCFSVRPPTPAPPSLQNIYKALKKEYPSFEPPPNKGGLLTPWADRGVLLLNTCLTVRAHEANSHSGKGWEKFTQKVIDLVCQKRTHGVVFLAWGSPAQKRCAGINGSKHYVLKSVHPSPLSAHKGFANEWLKERYGDDGVIDWNLNLAPEDAGRLRKRKARTEVSDSSDSSDSSSSSESDSSDSEPTPKKQTVVKSKAKANTVQRSPSRSSSPEEDQTTTPSTSGPQVGDTKAEDAFTSFYLRQMTTEFAEDLDKIRSAGDFNDKSLGLLIGALKQGRECFDRHDRLAVGKAIIAASQ
ncbi:unnamed protein product [Aureobasidium vineae]|uniref:Uracil-DNA glycosylase-like domain-containing protein n=1 Tax=Aureobasidium vineae TaxID=2773715 RepID=A0A9N8JC94_9PEZI|nr:unnamed protein product [Aureobasidium vineae]